LSFNKEKINLKRSLDEMAQRSEAKFYLFNKILGGQYKFHKELIITHQTSDEFFIKLKELGLIPHDLSVKSVKMGSPADKAQVKAGDIFVSINGEEIYSFEALRNKLQISKEAQTKLEFYRGGVLQKVEITPEVKTDNDQTIKLIGVYSGGEFLSPNFIMTESKGLGSSLVTALDRTWDGTVKTFDGFKKLLKAEAPFKSIGGPLSIGKVASDSFNTSLSYFFQLMALISINLGIINLFPIPVLDGGHIMFIIFEIINRGPLSERKMEIAQQVGLSILLMLMVGAIFNDFSRFF
ncbi:MAG: RIP metalloprotease RseP, partial [Bacteriovoracaceae bacterium]